MSDDEIELHIVGCLSNYKHGIFELHEAARYILEFVRENTPREMMLADL